MRVDVGDGCLGWNIVMRGHLWYLVKHECNRWVVRGEEGIKSTSMMHITSCSMDLGKHWR